MGALCLLPSTPPSCSCGAAHLRLPKLAATPFPSSSAAASGARLRLLGRRGRRADVARGGRAGEEEGGKNGEAAFFGEDGVVEDMDGYLNFLSLEYDSVWDTKPAWCQPWTILLSGTVAVACSWVLIHSIVITAGVSFVTCAWWYIFLYSYPKGACWRVRFPPPQPFSAIAWCWGSGYQMRRLDLCLRVNAKFSHRLRFNTSA